MLGTCFTFQLCELGLLLHTDIVHHVCIGSHPIPQWIFLRAKSADVRINDISEVFQNPHLKLFLHTIQSDLKGKQFFLSHTKAKIRRKASELDLKNTARTYTFEWENKTVTVEQYFQAKYGKTLEHPNWPLVFVKRSNKVEYYPLEVCVLESGQTRRDPPSNERREILSATKVNLQQRFSEISAQLSILSTQIKEQKDIPMEVKHEPVQVEGRVLPCPAVVYRGNQLVQSEKGEWKQPKEAKFFQPSTSCQELHVCYPDHILDEELNPFIGKLLKAIKEKIGIQPKEKVYILFSPFSQNSFSITTFFIFSSTFHILGKTQ